MKTTVSIVSLAAMLAGPAIAQTTTGAPAPEENVGIAEIVVTAEKRSENIQDVPISISAFTATALQERAVTSVASLSNISPNVTLDAGTPFSGSSYVLSAYIRGIGANDFAFNIDPGVGIYLDGVYLARSIGANQELGDVERVEVLKGPQGTLFGRNTIGGAIEVITHDPGKDFRFAGDVTGGSFRLLQARGTVDLPLLDGLSSSVSFAIKNRNGYLHRIAFPGVGSTVEDPITSFRAAGYDGAGLGTEGGDSSWNLRGKLRWDNGGPFTATLAADYNSVDQDALANKLISVFAPVFASTYNNAIAGIPGSIAGPPSSLFQSNRGGLNSPFDLSPIYGVNVDANPFNDRLPYDDRFLTGNINTSYANGNNFSRLKNYGISGIMKYDFTENLSVKSITAYRKLHWTVGSDLDGSPLDFLHTSFDSNQKQFSQEVQLLGTLLDKKLNYVVGAYYFRESGDLHDFVTFADGLLQVDGPNTLKTKNYAFFGQVDYRPIDLVGITFGGRYTHEDKEFEGFQSDNNAFLYKIFGFPVTEAGRVGLCDLSTALFNAGVPGVTPACFPNPNQPTRFYIAGVQYKKFNNFSPKVGLQLHPNDDILIYGSWSKGYKTGGWTTRLGNPLSFAPDFDEEKATTWEIGAKTDLFNRRLQINGALFTTNYKGIQLNFQQGISPTIQNAGDARIRGFELEIVAAPVRGFTINGSVGYTDAYYTSVLPQAVVAPSPIQEGVAVGTTLPKTPKWKFNISPRYEADLGAHGKLVFLLDYTHSTSLKNDTEGTFLLNRPATDILNASVTYRDPRDQWNLTIGGTNLTDERYLTTGQAQLAGGQIYGTYSRPAEWYVKLGYKF